MHLFSCPLLFLLSLSLFPGYARSYILMKRFSFIIKVNKGLMKVLQLTMKTIDGLNKMLPLLTKL
jgi:hypothetical protein